MNSILTASSTSIQIRKFGSHLKQSREAKKFIANYYYVTLKYDAGKTVNCRLPLFFRKIW